MFTLLFAYWAATAQPAIAPQAVASHARFETVQKALDLYYADCGHYPPTPAGLEALRNPSKDCENWGPNPYLAEIPLDENGRPFMYFGSNRSYLLRGFGRDGRPGGEGPDRDTDYPRGEIKFYQKIGIAKPAPVAGVPEVAPAKNE